MRHVGEKLQTALDMPKDFVRGRIGVNIEANTSCTVEGSCGIIEYTDEIVRIATDQYMIKITGRNLVMRTVTTEYLIIDGIISIVEYIL